MDTELAGPRFCWKDVFMPPRKRRSYTTEYKVEAAHRVIDSGRTISEVARELGIDIISHHRTDRHDTLLRRRGSACHRW
ncbi:MAG: transposase [Saccharothrix sp.]|nr:transposase [Saccharothrix sp.]